MVLHTQQISNSKDFPEVSRSIHIIGVGMNADMATFDLYYRLSYNKDGQDVSHSFNPQVPLWHIDNTQLMRKRNQRFEPIPNPDFIEDIAEDGTIINENDRYETMPAFDYIKTLMLDMEVPLKTIISAYVAEEDQDGRFNTFKE